MALYGTVPSFWVAEMAIDPGFSFVFLEIKSLTWVRLSLLVFPKFIESAGRE